MSGSEELCVCHPAPAHVGHLHLFGRGAQYQSPQLVVVECNMMGNNTEYHDDGVNFSFMDDLRFSLDKVELAFASAPEGERGAPDLRIL